MHKFKLSKIRLKTKKRVPLEKLHKESLKLKKSQESKPARKSPKLDKEARLLMLSRGSDEPDNDTLLHAKRLYFNFVKLIHIAQETGITYNRLRYFIYQHSYSFQGKTYKGWIAEREELEKEVHKEAKTSLRNAAYAGTEIGFELILNGLKSFKDMSLVPDLKEQKDLAQIVKTLHSITLAEDQKEDISSEQKPQQLLDHLVEDKFFLKGLNRKEKDRFLERMRGDNDNE